MASLQKVKITRYLDRDGKQVPKGTPGAVRVQTESEKWYGCFREGKRLVRVPLAIDKDVAQVMLGELIKQRARGEAGMVNPYKEHLDAALADHVADYVAEVTATTRSEQYHRELSRVLNLFVRDGKCPRLRDVNPDRVSRYLNRMTAGPTTRNHHRRGIVMLMNWLEDKGRIDRTPLTKRNVKTAKKGEKRERRALTGDEIARLLDAVKDYPVKSASVNTGGRNAKKKPAARPAKLKPATLAKLQQRGRERWLMYRLAVLTGLRRGELSRLRVAHLHLDRQPFAQIDLPGHLTKNGKPARINLVPSLAADLRQWIADTGRQPGDPVVAVPTRCNLSKLHKAHLALAGIPYVDAHNRRADFHSLRMAANVMLRKAGIPPKERQLFLRHGKQELTTEIYDDATATEMAAVVAALAETKL